MQSTRTTQTALLIGIAITLSLGIGVAAAASGLGVSDESAPAGEQTEVHVSLEDAPEGLQRYNVTVHLENGDVATVESAAAGDVESFQVRAKEDDAITFRAADLAESVQPGATDVSLGTVRLSTTNPGTSSVSVTVHDLRTDEGEQVRPSTQAGTLTVRDDATAGDDGQSDSRRGLSSRLPGSPTVWAGGGAVLVAVLVGIALGRRR